MVWLPVSDAMTARQPRITQFAYDIEAHLHSGIIYHIPYRCTIKNC